MLAHVAPSCSRRLLVGKPAAAAETAIVAAMASARIVLMVMGAVIDGQCEYALLPFRCRAWNPANLYRPGLAQRRPDGWSGQEGPVRERVQVDCAKIEQRKQLRLTSKPVLVSSNSKLPGCHQWAARWRAAVSSGGSCSAGCAAWPAPAARHWPHFLLLLYLPPNASDSVLHVRCWQLLGERAARMALARA